jgi:hypothetical protein
MYRQIMRIALFIGLLWFPIHPALAGAAWDPFLDTLQANTIRWFLHATPQETGATPDRWPTQTACSIAAVGFALTVYPIAVERQILSREEALDRALTTLRFFLKLQERENAKLFTSYKGFFYHFIDAHTGERYWHSELSTVDTALLLMGALFCQSYFDRPDRAEQEVRAAADSLYHRTDWRWAMQDTAGVMMSWSPEEGFNKTTWHGYNEALFLYVLSLASPSHPVPESAYAYWLSTYRWGRHCGEEYLQFTPLFGFQYAQCWIDFRGIHDAFTRDMGVDYFEISRRATYANRNYAIKNPGDWKGYSDSLWGFTACDGPGDIAPTAAGRTFRGYSARGSSAAYVDDDGTIAPTAPGGSLPFAPEICIPALKAMRRTYGGKLFTQYGFRDAFNPTFITPQTPDGWFDKDYLGIDQGPIVIMVENLRNGFVWRMMKKNPYIVEGLRKAGFTGGWLENRQDRPGKK